MIKRLMPRYNVLLRDDKSFPFIHLTAGHAFPQLTKYRGARTKDGSYFGPFASAGSVNRTLVTLQKAFSAGVVRGRVLGPPPPPLLALSDQAVQRSVRGPHQRRGVRGLDRPG